MTNEVRTWPQTIDSRKLLERLDRFAETLVGSHGNQSLSDSEPTGTERSVQELPAPEGQKDEGAASDRVYPCADCGVMRSKDEGGTVFTVCDACWDKHYGKKSDGADTAPRLIADRITEYLSSGGFFNPEMMEHDKVRALLIDSRDALQRVGSLPSVSGPQEKA